MGQLNQSPKYIATDNSDVETKFKVLLDYVARHAGEGDVQEGSAFAREVGTKPDPHHSHVL